MQVASASPTRRQVRARFKKGPGADISVVQWLRFGSGAYLHIVGMAPAPAWTQAYARFRSVRDGIEAR